jgi:hypothetical protein
MFKPSDLKRAFERALDSPAITALSMVALLAVPVVATSGVSSIESQDAPRTGAYSKDFKGTFNYQMRCWQHGRLLFEQALVELPTDGSRYQLKVSGSDRNGRPVYVAETGNATCLIRSIVADSGSTRPLK